MVVQASFPKISSFRASITECPWHSQISPSVRHGHGLDVDTVTGSECCVTAQRSGQVWNLSCWAGSSHLRTDKTIKCTHTYPEWSCVSHSFSHNSLKLEYSINSELKANCGCLLARCMLQCFHLRHQELPTTSPMTGLQYKFQEHTESSSQVQHHNIHCYTFLSKQFSLSTYKKRENQNALQSKSHTPNLPLQIFHNLHL